MTEKEFIKANGDESTRFTATRADLTSLAHKLADEVLGWKFCLRLNVSYRDLKTHDYIAFRLSRVLDCLPELRPEIEDKIRLGERENEVGARKIFDEWERNARKDKCVPHSTRKEQAGDGENLEPHLSKNRAHKHSG